MELNKKCDFIEKNCKGIRCVFGVMVDKSEPICGNTKEFKCLLCDAEFVKQKFGNMLIENEG